MKGYYDAIAQGYNDLHKEEQLSKMRIIKEHLKIAKKDKLLDVGCGTGLSSDFGCIVYGIDPSKRLLDRCPLPLRMKKHANAESIPYPSRFFDIVISVSAVHNFGDIEKGLREMKRVGKKKFVITVLKRSPKREKIESMIRKHFKIMDKAEEDKDIIFFLA